MDASLNALQMQYKLDGNGLVHLMPTHVKTMFGVAADAWGSPDIEQWRSALCTQIVRRGELRVPAGDGTMKVCMGLKGQLRRRDGGGPIPAEQGGGAWKANDTYTVIYSVCTSLGGTLGLETVQSEKGADVNHALCRVVHPHDRHHVRWILVDNPSASLLRLLRVEFPNLTVLAMDTVHLAMKYESTRGGKRTAGSRLLRRLLRKFHEPVVAGDDARQVWSGTGDTVETDAQATALRHLRFSSMPSHDVKRALARIYTKGPWRSLDEWIEALAALATKYPHDMAGHTAKTKTLRNKLIAAASASRFGWYHNNSNTEDRATAGQARSSRTGKLAVMRLSTGPSATPSAKCTTYIFQRFS